MDKAMSARTRYGPSGLRDAGSSRRYFGGPPTAPLEDCRIIKKYYLGTTRKKTLRQYYVYCSKKDNPMLVVKIEKR